MYYINCFFIYSFIGYLFETFVAAVTHNNFESGILYGPITPIYGFGIILVIIISHYLFYHLHMPRWLETIITFFALVFILTLLEYIAGTVLEMFIGYPFWDYSGLKYHIGHYISLEVSLGWGILSILLIYFVKEKLDMIIYKIPKLLSYLLIILLCIDIVFTIIKK